MATLQDNAPAQSWSWAGAALTLGVMVAFFFGFQWWTQHQVISEAKSQYEIVQRGGTPGQKCVAAEFVQAAYLQAKDEAHWNEWKAVTARECAGLR